jgi:hypothetical protein
VDNDPGGTVDGRIAQAHPDGMRWWRDLGTGGRLVLAGCLVLAVVGVAVAVRLLDRGGVPEAFVERPPLPACGTVRVDLAVPEGPEVDCFDEALRAGRAAELVVTSSTVEGDEITTYYRSVPGQEGLEYWLDATRDAFGSGSWEHVRCLEATGLDDHRNCQAA